MRYFISATLMIGAVIHLLPLAGVTGAPRLAQLYGIDASDSNLLILMQHRAVLFGILGGFLAYAAFNPSHQIAAFIAGLVSVGSFMFIALQSGGYNAQISKVLVVDALALFFLILGVIARLMVR